MFLSCLLELYRQINAGLGAHLQIPCYDSSRKVFYLIKTMYLDFELLRIT